VAISLAGSSHSLSVSQQYPKIHNVKRGGLSATPLGCVRFFILTSQLYLTLTILTGFELLSASLRKYTPAASPSPIFSPLYVPTILPVTS
jgi:hypothetical protein